MIKIESRYDYIENIIRHLANSKREELGMYSALKKWSVENLCSFSRAVDDLFAPKGY